MDLTNFKPKNDKEVFEMMKKSPIYFIRLMWKLRPMKEGEEFVKGKHITNQQHDILLAVEKAIAGEAQNRISIASGHGIGKTATLSWLLLWYLFCHKESQIPCTAPTSDQIYDVLWKEIAKWLHRMPEAVQEKYEWTTSYVRITERPETWFARAKTARKENPEALAGIHADYVMALVDEASGVPDTIFETAEGIFTNENILVVLISNPTRLDGYFYDTHHTDKHAWQTLQFSSIDSQIVDEKFNNRIIEKYGIESDEYRIRVLGEFPREDAIDDKGYVRMIQEKDLHFVRLQEPMGRKWLGVDPAGEGANETVWVLRDNFRARVLAKEPVSDAKGIAEKTGTLVREFGIADYQTIVDIFGVGATVMSELAYSGIKATGINVGDKPIDRETYLNMRAECYWKLREWLKTGGELIEQGKWEQLLQIKYKRNLRGKIQIMSKDEMRRNGIASPDVADALMLTFVPMLDAPINHFKDIAALEQLDYAEW